MKIDGGCHCNEIAFEVEIDTKQASICPCTDCPTLGGSTFSVGAVALDGMLKFLSGRPKPYVEKAQNHTPQKQAFCNNFGSRIYSSWQGFGEPQSYRLRDQLSPKTRICNSSVKSWFSEIGAVRIVETK